MNIVILVGRLTADPTRRVNEFVKSVSFTIAVDRHYINKKTGKPDTDFIQCQMTEPVTNDRTDVLMKYFKKGDPIMVQGYWRVDIVDKDGKREYYHKCDVNKISFCPINNSKNINNTSDNTPVSEAVRVIPGKKSSWQQSIVEPENINYNRDNVYNVTQSTNAQTPITPDPFIQPNEPVDESISNNDIIPQAFDVGIDMSDEFLF